MRRALPGYVYALVATGAVATAALADDSTNAEREGLIFERQQIMTQLSKDSETLGNIAAGLEPASNLTAVTKAVAQGARESRDSFKEPLPGGRSKPEVWSNHADFMAKMDNFVRETDEMARLGEAGNLPAITEKMVTALPCKACHDQYRLPKVRPQ